MGIWGWINADGIGKGGYCKMLKVCLAFGNWDVIRF